MWGWGRGRSRYQGGGSERGSAGRPRRRGWGAGLWSGWGAPRQKGACRGAARAAVTGAGVTRQGGVGAPLASRSSDQGRGPLGRANNVKSSTGVTGAAAVVRSLGGGGYAPPASARWHQREVGARGSAECPAPCGRAASGCILVRGFTTKKLGACKGPVLVGSVFMMVWGAAAQRGHAETVPLYCSNGGGTARAASCDGGMGCREGACLQGPRRASHSAIGQEAQVAVAGGSEGAPGSPLSWGDAQLGCAGWSVRCVCRTIASGRA